MKDDKWQMTEKLIPYTFKTSGVEIAIRPISTFLMQAAQRSVPLPTPPTERVQNADGTWREEPNSDHPSYATALAEHRVATELMVRRLVIRQAVVYRLTDDDHAQIAGLRETFRDVTGKDLDGDDMEVFVSDIAILSMADYQDFVQTVLGVSQPTDPKSQNGAIPSMSATTA